MKAGFGGSRHAREAVAPPEQRRAAHLPQLTHDPLLQVFIAPAPFPRTAVCGLADLAMWLVMGRSSEGGREPHRRPARASSRLRPVGEGLADLVGNTPLIRIRSLSEQTGCEVGCWTSITPAQLNGRAKGPGAAFVPIQSLAPHAGRRSWPKRSS